MLNYRDILEYKLAWHEKSRNIIHACRPGLLCPHKMASFPELIYTIYSIILFAGVSAQEVCSAGDRDILVTGRQQSFSTSAHKEMSSNDETSNFQKEVFVNSQKTQPADVVPHDTDDSSIVLSDKRVQPQWKVGNAKKWCCLHL